MNFWSFYGLSCFFALCLFTIFCIFYFSIIYDINILHSLYSEFYLSSSVRSCPSYDLIYDTLVSFILLYFYVNLTLRQFFGKLFVFISLLSYDLVLFDEEITLNVVDPADSNSSSATKKVGSGKKKKRARGDEGTVSKRQVTESSLDQNMLPQDRSYASSY